MKRLVVMCTTIFLVLVPGLSVVGCAAKEELPNITHPPELTRTIIHGKAPFFIGEGDTNLTCGKCGTILAKNIVNGQLRDIVFECPTCGEYCEQKTIPPLPKDITRTIRILEGNVYFGSPVHIPRDAVIAGS